MIQTTRVSHYIDPFTRKNIVRILNDTIKFLKFIYPWLMSFRYELFLGKANASLAR